MISKAPILTDAGRSLLLRAVSGEELTFTRFKIGDGSLEEGQTGRELTDLINEVLEVGISEMTVLERGIIELDGEFDSNDVDQDFTWRELGLFAKGEDEEEVLYAYANDGADAGTMPAQSEDVYTGQVIKLLVVVGEAEHVTAFFNPRDEFVSHEEFNAHAEDQDNPHNVTKEQVGLGNVLNTTPENTTVAFQEAGSRANIVSGEKMSVLFGKIKKGFSDLFDHLNSRNNPHNVTRSQVGAAAVNHTHEKEIFWATYGTTTWEGIYDALYNKDQQVWCAYDNFKYALMRTVLVGVDVACVFIAFDKAGTMHWLELNSNGNTWSSGTGSGTGGSDIIELTGTLSGTTITVASLGGKTVQDLADAKEVILHTGDGTGMFCLHRTNVVYYSVDTYILAFSGIVRRYGSTTDSTMTVVFNLAQAAATSMTGTFSEKTAHDVPPGGSVGEPLIKLSAADYDVGYGESKYDPHYIAATISGSTVTVSSLGSTGGVANTATIFNNQLKPFFLEFQSAVLGVSSEDFKLPLTWQKTTSSGMELIFSNIVKMDGTTYAVIVEFSGIDDDDTSMTGTYSKIDLGPDRVVWVTYGTTSFADIAAAVEAGKIVACLYNAHVYQLTGLMNTSQVHIAQFSAKLSPQIDGVLTRNENSWSSSTVRVAPEEVTVSTAGDVTRALDAGKIYHFTGVLTSLIITLNAPDSGNLAQYHFDFDSGSTAPTLTLPNTVTMPTGFQVEANKHYEIDILDGYGTAQSW